ncbi:queuosine biosynthesis protein queC [Mycobacterium kansasii]
MTSSAHLVRPRGATGITADGYTALDWPNRPRRASSTVISDLGWNLAPLATTTRRVADLVHFAGGAYMADRNTPRGARFSRDLALRVAVLDPDAWTEDILDAIADLLGWLTGDVWNVTTIPAPDVELPECGPREPHDGPISLLSGGLDSFMGAVQLLQSGSKPSLAGHKDSATVIRGAQRRSWMWLARSFSPPPSYTRIELTQSGPRVEASSRSRALMFMSLGVAVAVSAGANTLVIPENGYTSINLPLRPNRGGALSTRSTHPETLHRFTNILQSLEIAVAIDNPYQWMTKGEIMTALAGNGVPEGWQTAAAATLSCSKLDGRWFGASTAFNCGLCVPCMVRRATFIKAGVQDDTAYVYECVTEEQRHKLIDARRGDIEAVKYAIANGVDPDAIDAGTWPPGYDLDQADDLVQRGLNELAMLTLP